MAKDLVRLHSVSANAKFKTEDGKTRVNFVSHYAFVTPEEAERVIKDPRSQADNIRITAIYPEKSGKAPVADKGGEIDPKASQSAPEPGVESGEADKGKGEKAGKKSAKK